MSRTILELAQEAAERATVAAPSKLFGSNDRIARILKVAAIDTMRELMLKAPNDGWSALQSTWVFELIAGQYIYDLPPDFAGVIHDAEQRNGWPMGLLGPVGPIAWSAWLNGVTIPSTPYGWRVKGHKLHMNPVPQATELIQIEYKSRYMVATPIKDLSTSELAGKNFPKLPLIPAEGMIEYKKNGWGVGTWANAKWADYDKLDGTTLATFLTELQREMADGSLGWKTTTGPYARKEFFTQDTDQTAFQDAHLVSLGMTWRLLKGLRKPYADVRDEYERQADYDLSNDAGGGRDIYLGSMTDWPQQTPLDNNGKWVIS